MREETMPDLTEEEYDALDEKWTKNPPKPGPNGTGFFAQRKAALTETDFPATSAGGTRPLRTHSVTPK
jgi:hypothetical protein